MQIDNTIIKLFDKINDQIRDITKEIVTNANPESDEVKYTWNTVLKYRIADMRWLKKMIISELKRNVDRAAKWKKKSQDVKLFSDAVEKFINDKKDLLEDKKIKFGWQKKW